MDSSSTESTPASAGTPEGDAPILVLTDVARERILSVREQEDRPNAGLRVTVEEDGPAAFRYLLDFVEADERGEDDTVLDAGGLQVVIDPESAGRLRGASLDFVEELSDSYFKFDNPNKPPLLRDPVAARVQKVIEERINPSVASHGGRITLIDYREGRVFVQLGGGCQGCGMADVTLKQGIESSIMAEVEEVTEVLDTTDHAGGTNPYYKPGK